MRIALAQTNPTIGDISGNTDGICRMIDAAREQDVDLVVFPEMSVIGYPPKDLLLKPACVEACLEAVQVIAEHCRGVAAIVGYPCLSDSDDRGRPLYNAANLCRDGACIDRHVKSLLPTYDVFDETRYFEPGPQVQLTTYQGVPIGISICEDLWNNEGLFSRRLYHDNPIDRLAGAGAKLFINCSASPFILRKHEFRLKLLQHTAKQHGIPIVYCNQVGGNDELIFDGNSCVVDERGALIAHARAFEPDLLTVDLPQLGYAEDGKRPNRCGGVSWADAEPAPKARIELPLSKLGSLYGALTLGLRDYCRKCGFQSVVLGLSGGIDSAVTAALCVGALGSEAVRGVTMPSRYSSAGSVSDAAALAENLGIPFDEVAIGAAHDAVEQMLAKPFAGLEPDVTEENIQARLRGLTLMAFSNKFGCMLVTTGNKSELAVGYCTLYGDMAGGLAVLSDVPKTDVYAPARSINTPACPLHRAVGGPPIPAEPDMNPAPSIAASDQLGATHSRGCTRQAICSSSTARIRAP